MTAAYLKHEIIEYLNEQEIKYSPSEPLRSLVIKAMKEGYSPSDEMYTVENGIYIPSDHEIKLMTDSLSIPK